MKVTANSVEDYDAIANVLLSQFKEQQVFAFVGKMGAGKTTFIKSICKKLGVEEMVSSPTFSLVNEYGAGKSVVYHFDMYRIEDESEAQNIGFQEYLQSGNYCLIEWPDKVSSYLPEELVVVKIEEANGSRNITAQLA